MKYERPNPPQDAWLTTLRCRRVRYQRYVVADTDRVRQLIVTTAGRRVLVSLAEHMCRFATAVVVVAVIVVVERCVVEAQCRLVDAGASVVVERGVAEVQCRLRSQRHVLGRRLARTRCRL